MAVHLDGSCWTRDTRSLMKDGRPLHSVFRVTGEECLACVGVCAAMKPPLLRPFLNFTHPFTRRVRVTSMNERCRVKSSPRLQYPSSNTAAPETGAPGRLLQSSSKESQHVLSRIGVRVTSGLRRRPHRPPPWPQIFHPETNSCRRVSKSSQPALSVMSHSMPNTPPPESAARTTNASMFSARLVFVAGWSLMRETQTPVLAAGRSSFASTGSPSSPMRRPREPSIPAGLRTLPPATNISSS